MRLNKFEKYIAKKVDEYPSKLDTDSLWATLESDLEKKKRRRFFIVFFTLFSIFTIGGFFVYKFQTAENQPVLSEVSTVEAVESSAPEMTPLTEDKRKNENENENTISNIGSGIGAVAKQPQEQSLRQVVQATGQENKNTASQTESSVDNVTALSSQENVTEASQELIEGNNPAQIEKLKNIGEVTFLDFPKMNFLEQENDLSTKKDLPKIDPVKNWSLYISPTFGVYYTDRNISQKNTNGAILKDLRNSSEKTLETMSLGIGVELKNRNNFFLTGGISFNQLTERFNNQSSEFTTEDIEIVTEVNYLSNGQVEEITGTYEQPHEIITTTEVYNTLRWAEFNVGGGYYFTKKRCDIGVSGGLLWGTMLNTEGKILDAENNIVEIENQNPGIYKNDLGLGAFANVEVRYTLRPRLRLSTQFGYKRMSGSFTEEAYPLEINYQWWGATVGLQYKIY